MTGLGKVGPRSHAMYVQVAFSLESRWVSRELAPGFILFIALMYVGVTNMMQTCE